MMPQIFILNQVRVPQYIFKDLKGAMNQKKVEKTGVDCCSVKNIIFHSLPAYNGISFFNDKHNNLKLSITDCLHNFY
jgi:hypothetical protein